MLSQIDIKALRPIIKVLSTHIRSVNLVFPKSKPMQKTTKLQADSMTTSATCFVGIDVSKLTLDVTLISSDKQDIHVQVSNDSAGFAALEAWLEQCDEFSYGRTIFCMEHTGIYTRQLVEFLLGREAKVWLESALHLKRSMGMTRGKNDKVDSLRIARYAMTNVDKARFTALSNSTLQLIKDLMANRDRINKALKSLQTVLKETTGIDKKTGRELAKVNRKAIAGLKQSKKECESRISTLIGSDPELSKVYELVTSIKGVGLILATELMVYTHMFTRMTGTRQLACYCGVAPFSYSSGTSIRGRVGTSNFANVHLKSTLHLAAVSSIRYVPDLRAYYERKVGEGKSKMTVINAVRNKILHRVLAVVKRGTPYIENYTQMNLENS